MVTQYPDSIVFVAEPVITVPTQDADGNWIQPDQSGNQTLSQVCRAELSKKAYVIPGQDGVKIEVGFMIFMPVDSVEIPFGVFIKVYDKYGKYKGQGNNKRFERGEVDCQLFLV